MTPGLPHDPHAAMVEVRRLLAAEMGPLLHDTGQRWTAVRFLLVTSETDETAYQGHLLVTVAQSSSGPDLGGELEAAARLRGWEPVGPSHRLDLVKTPFRLTSSPDDGGGRRWEIRTSALRPESVIEGTDERSMLDVPELADYRDG
ncbi:MAG: hypothetical protein ABI083_02265 [Lapillicoccus sp.]